jgi:DNA invertase Pin-like site-specific DNA recombinase
MKYEKFWSVKDRVQTKTRKKPVKIDHSIVMRMYFSGRASTSEIARKLHTSRSAVLQIIRLARRTEPELIEQLQISGVREK